LVCENRAALKPSTKASLAQRLTDVSEKLFQTPADLISVVFHDLPPESTYRSGHPTTETVIICYIREGRSSGAIESLMKAISATWSEITGDSEGHIEIVVQQIPDQFTMRGGGRLPEAARV
jgi:phenylpyruvate tautomerase PptA (4-oxalocrotonate tautomerase family)